MPVQPKRNDMHYQKQREYKVLPLYQNEGSVQG